MGGICVQGVCVCVCVGGWVGGGSTFMPPSSLIYKSHEL